MKYVSELLNYMIITVLQYTVWQVRTLYHYIVTGNTNNKHFYLVFL